MFSLKTPSKLTEISSPVGWITAPLLASFVVALISLIVVSGWMFDVDFLKRIIPGYVVMNPVTAMLFVLSSVVLLLLHSDSARQILVGKIFAAGIALVGLIKLCAIIGFFDVGIDRIFFTGEFLDKVTGQPNRMAPTTAVNFLLLGIALLLFRIKARRRVFYAAQYPAMAIFLISMAAIIGYLYDAKAFYVLFSFNPMAIHTAISFSLLAGGMLLSKHAQGIIRDTFNPDIGERTAKELANFKFALDQSSIVSVTDRRGKIIYVNDKFCEISQYSREELYGQDHRIINSGFHSKEFIKNLWETISSGSVWRGEMQNRAKQTGGYWVDTIIVPFLGGDGKPYQHVAISSDTTARKQSEQLLRDSETSYRQLADAMPQIVWTARPDGFLDYYNQRWFDYTGMTLEQTAGWGWEPVLHPEDLQKCIDVWSEALETGDKYKVEYRFKRGSTGEYRWHLGQALPVRNAEKQIVKWFGTCTDIHEQKKVQEELRQIQEDLELRVKARTVELEQTNAVLKEQIVVRERVERALTESTERERAMIENALDVICTIDAAGLFVTMNPACFRMWGYQPEELIGRRFIEFVATEDVAATLEVNASILAGSAPTDFENRCVHKNGTLVNIRWTAHWSESEQLVFAVAHDVTERKRAEEAIRRSEEKYRNILETIEEGYFETDLNGDFTFFNDALCDLIGYGCNELNGLNYRQYVDDENAGKLKQLFAEVYQTNQSRHLSKWEIIRKNGERKIHESSVSPIRNEKGEPIGFRGIIRDITERIRSEEKLGQSQQLLKLVIDTLPQAIWWKDKELNYIGCNRFLAEIAGLNSPEQIIGLSDYDMPWKTEEADFYRECDRRVMRTGIPELNIIEPIRQADGRQAWLNTNKAPLRNSEGEIVGIIGAFADVTEQRRADAALRESEYKIRMLLKSMREGLLQVDEMERVTFVNDCFCEMVGYTSEELMKTDWTLLIFDDDGHNLVEQANRRRRDGISDSYELCLRKKSGERFWAIVGGAPIINAEGFAAGSMGVFTDITERKRVEQQLQHDAFHDALTGLANRTLFTDHLQMTIERTKRDRSELFAVLFLDFDRFKIINDSLGHAEGDNLLRQIARRLESSLRSGDLVARLGGDEFTILVNKLDDSSVALRIAERIQKNLQTPFEIGGGEIYISASIGIALSTTGHERAEDMLRDADIAMYRAKSKGKAQFQVFDRAMHEQASKQLRLEIEIRQALEREEFLLHYQPIINLENENLTGFESLVRWEHPERGMIPPFEFIGAAEENRLILPLGQWILHESCRQMRQWQNENLAAANLTVSVNLSSKQFSQSDLAEQVAATLKKTGLEPRCLKLEITESHIMENTEMAVKTMSNLRALGVELSLDDFGTGYSSLSYLHRLPVSSLKIDRSFVTRMIGSEENSEIVHTIIKLARNLKMKVVAEGIETGEQLAQLRMLNCEYGQGYFIAKPMEAHAAQMFINSHSVN